MTISIKEMKLKSDSDTTRIYETTDWEDKPIDVTFYYLHHDHGFMAYQHLTAHPELDHKCPLPGCGRKLVSGKAPRRKGVLIKGHIR
jgi:hypothetical protein